MMQSGHIRLRKVEPTDLPFLYRWENDSTSWNDSCTHNPLSRKDLSDYIGASTGDIYKDAQLRLIIESIANNKAIQMLGCIDLYDFDPHNARAGVGIYIEKEMRRQGIAAIALRILEQYAFRLLRLRMLYAFVSEQNTASQHLFASANWRHTATLPEWNNNASILVFQQKRPID